MREKENNAFFESFQFQDSLRMKIDIVSFKEVYENQNELAFAHWHNELELIYCFGGRDTFYIHGKPVYAQNGKLIVVNPNEIHYIEVKDHEKVQNLNINEYAYIIFFISKQYYSRLFNKKQCPCFVNEIMPNAFLEQCFKEIRLYMNGKQNIRSLDNDIDYLLVNGILQLAFYKLCITGWEFLKQPENKLNSKNGTLKNILLFLNEHYSEQIKQKEVAEMFHFSSQSFSRFFHSHTGMTYTEYLTRIRIRQIREELLTTDKTLTEIALNNGFSDERRCIIAFKKYFNDTPGKYRSRYFNQER